VTWRRSLPEFHSSRCTPGSLPSPLHWFMVWRALYPSAHLPYSRENAESFCCLPVDAKTGSGAASFSYRDAGLCRPAGLGAADGDEPAQTGAGNAVWRPLWFTDGTCANLLYFGVPRYVDHRTYPDGESNHYRYGGKCHRDLQLRTVRR